MLSSHSLPPIVRTSRLVLRRQSPEDAPLIKEVCRTLAFSYYASMVLNHRRVSATCGPAKRAILSWLALTCAVGAVYGPLAHGQSSPPVSGCYRFDRRYFAATDYSVGVSGATDLVLLDTTVVDQRGARVLRLFSFEVDSIVSRSRVWLRKPYWKPMGDSVFVSWHTGLHGPLLTLGVRGDSLVGRVVFASDAIAVDPVTRVPVPPRSEKAWAVRTPCPR
jgi:hypothetical protein